jgi:pSer/pThr/pTyr-binding forkhead associated (FHA) protein/ribosomal protein L40E
MIVCPNCNHQNPEGASQCEACYAPLPITIGCPNCGASVQSDATFCGQCGFNLQAEVGQNFGMSSGFPPDKQEQKVAPVSELAESGIPPTTPSMSNPSPWDDDIAPLPSQPIAREPIESELNGFEARQEEPTQPGKNYFDFSSETYPESSAESASDPYPANTPSSYTESASDPYGEIIEEDPYPELVVDPNIDLVEDTYSESIPAVESAPKQEESIYTPPPITPSKPATASLSNSATQLQTQKVSLYHVQTNTNLDVAQHLSIIHLGKPNSQIPPDVDVSGFPNSEIVSRVHADIRVEGDAYFIEDMGSSNGTYINHTPLLPGNRHRLRNGDRIALGKGDKVTFIFQVS